MIRLLTKGYDNRRIECAVIASVLTDKFGWYVQFYWEQSTFKVSIFQLVSKSYLHLASWLQWLSSSSLVCWSWLKVLRILKKKLPLQIWRCLLLYSNFCELMLCHLFVKIIISATTEDDGKMRLPQLRLIGVQELGLQCSLWGQAKQGEGRERKRQEGTKGRNERRKEGEGSLRESRQFERRGGGKVRKTWWKVITNVSVSFESIIRVQPT